jgi:hypothetical protein
MAYLAVHYRGLFYFIFGAAISMIFGFHLRFHEPIPMEKSLESNRQEVKDLQTEVKCRDHLEKNTRNPGQNLTKSHISRLQKQLPDFSQSTISEQIEKRREFVVTLAKTLTLMVEFFTIQEVDTIRFPQPKDGDLKEEIQTHEEFVRACKQANAQISGLKHAIEERFEEFARKIKTEGDRIVNRRRQFMSSVKTVIGDFERMTKEQNWHQYDQMRLTSERQAMHIGNMIEDFQEHCEQFFIEVLDHIRVTLLSFSRNQLLQSHVPSSPVKSRGSSVTTDNLMVHADRLYNSWVNKYDLFFERNDSSKQAYSALNQLVMLMDSFATVSESASKTFSKLMEDPEGLLLDHHYFERARDVFENLNINLMGIRQRAKITKGSDAPVQDSLVDTLRLSNKIFGIYFSFFEQKFDVQFINMPVIRSLEDLKHKSQRKRTSNCELEPPSLRTIGEECFLPVDFRQSQPFPFEHFMKKYTQILFKEYAVNAYYKVGSAAEADCQTRKKFQ